MLSLIAPSAYIDLYALMKVHVEDDGRYSEFPPEALLSANVSKMIGVEEDSSKSFNLVQRSVLFLTVLTVLLLSDEAVGMGTAVKCCIAWLAHRNFQ